MLNCKACEATESLDPHFDAIFDLMDEYGLDSEPLAMLRMDLHGEIARRLDTSPSP